MSTKMISNLYKLGLWRRKSRFLHALKSPQIMQDRVLKRITTKLAQTEYGRLFSVLPEDGYQAFSKKVPIVTYDHIRHLIERQRFFDRAILTDDPILSFERTSGLHEKSKLVPYTRELKQSFYNAYALTLSDMLDLDLNLRSGKTFLSMLHTAIDSENAQTSNQSQKNDKQEYFDSFSAKFLKRYLIVPPKVYGLYNKEDINHVLCLYLLSEPHLEVVSILNPAHFELLLDYIHNESDRLVPQLLRGHATIDGITFDFTPISQDRADLLTNPSRDWSKVWPELKVISCFTSGKAMHSVQSLHSFFSGVKFHSKGFLATEAPITVRLSQIGGYAPCIQDVFFEFVDEEGEIHLLSSLKEGKEYDLIISQLAGLYRYKIGDRVRVTHFYKNTPCLEYVGRTQTISDIAGEKLNEAYVRKCISDVMEDDSVFSILLPYSKRDRSPHYYLITNQVGVDENKYSQRFDDALCRAFHYRNARQKGKLEGVKIRSHQYAREIFIRYYSKNGLPFEDVNSCVLLNDHTKAQEFLALISREP